MDVEKIFANFFQVSTPSTNQEKEALQILSFFFFSIVIDFPSFIDIHSIVIFPQQFIVKMESNTRNGTHTADLEGQENVSDSLLDTSEVGDEADLESMRKRIHEMEEEAEKLKQMQLEVEKQMQLPTTPGTRKFQFDSSDCS